MIGAQHVIDKSGNSCRILGLAGYAPHPAAVASLRTMTEVRQGNDAKVAPDGLAVPSIDPGPNPRDR